MRRLLLVPVVVCPIAVVAWWSGLVWPIATQAWSVFAPRPQSAATEADPI